MERRATIQGKAAIADTFVFTSLPPLFPRFITLKISHKVLKNNEKFT